MAEKKLTITETPNELTDDIDIASPTEILRILRQSDAQLFSGWRHHPCIYDTQILHSIDLLVEKTKLMLIRHINTDNQGNLATNITVR